MKITVFGSSTNKPGDASYAESMHLGSLLAASGYDVITGGYMGSMEAVSRGASEAGAHVIGVTCKEIEAWRPTKANPWVMEEWQAPTLIDRLAILTRECDAALALPGGIGTLVEICLTWNQMVVQSFKPKPLIVIGAGWQQTFTSFFDALGAYTPPAYRQWLSFAPDVPSAVALLDQLITK